MKTPKRLPSERGFTLIEILVALAIAGVLAGIAGIAYSLFVEKAKTVEAETALMEVNRLESLYYSTYFAYSSDLHAIGYDPNPPLKYYAITVQLASGDSETVAYQATASPMSNQLETWTLTQYQNGTIALSRAASTTSGALAGGSAQAVSSNGGSSGGEAGINGTGAAFSAGGGGNAPRPNANINNNPANAMNGSAAIDQKTDSTTNDGRQTSN